MKLRYWTATRAAQDRASNPALGWLRAVALAAKGDGRMGETMTASALAELSEEHGIDLPGLRGTGDDDRRKHTGVLLARAIKKGAEFVEVDGITITRSEGQHWNEKHGGNVPVKTYVFTNTTADPLSENSCSIASTASTASTPIKSRETTPFYNNYSPCCSTCSDAITAEVQTPVATTETAPAETTQQPTIPEEAF